MARCLVVGGNGFIGSHLVDELVQRGHEVSVFDRFSSPSPRYSAQSVREFRGEFQDSAALAKALVGQEYVLHFLSTTTPITAQKDPQEDVRSNVTGSIELFTLASEAGVSRVIFASTGGAVYGDQPRTLVAEGDLPQPASPYAIGKLTIESYLRYFERSTGLRSTVLRISNPYGPGQNPENPQGVIPIFLRQVANDAPVTVFGDGSMVRDYLYITDAVRMVAEFVGSQPLHAVYNIGSGVGHSVNDLIKVVSEISGATVLRRERPVPPTFVGKIILDVKRFDDEFGHVRTAVSLEEGIRRTWEDVTRRG